MKNPNKNKTETTENISPTEVTGVSIRTSSALIQGITIPLQVPKKNIRSNSDSRIDPNTSEKCPSHDNFSVVASYQVQVQNPAILPFRQFNTTQRNITMYNQYTD